MNLLVELMVLVNLLLDRTVVMTDLMILVK